MSLVADGPLMKMSGRRGSSHEQLRHGRPDLVGVYHTEVDVRDQRDRAPSLVG
jgi:hypothetical protein